MALGVTGLPKRSVCQFYFSIFFLPKGFSYKLKLAKDYIKKKYDRNETAVSPEVSEAEKDQTNKCLTVEAAFVGCSQQQYQDLTITCIIHLKQAESIQPVNP